MGDIQGIEQTLQTVKERLEQVRGQLETLSGAIWRDIDHDDPEALEAGVRFKQRYNEHRGALEESMEAMIALLREYPDRGPGAGVGPSAADASAERVASAPPESPAAATPAEITESPMAGALDEKAPFGFVLGGQTYTSASAWPLFYEALLQELYQRAPETISHLADAPGRFVHAGRPLFARVPDRLDDPLPVADAIFAEADLDPGVLLSVIKGLMGDLGYPLDSFKILVKEKNRGTVETLSIAA